MPLTQANREIAIETPLGTDALLLRSVSIQEQLGRLFQMEADLISTNDKVNFDDIVGQNATIRLNLPGTNEPRHFNGFVSRFVQLDSEAGYPHYRATLVPWLWFLTRTADCRIFHKGMEKPPDKMTVPGIIMKVFSDHGFSDFKDRTSGTYREWEYCVQYRETDFNFVSRLMEQEGIYYYFEHENGKHTLMLADSLSGHNPFASYDAIKFRPRGQVGTAKGDVTTWTLEQEVQPGAYALNDFDFEKPKKALRTSKNITRNHASAAFEIYDFPGEYVEHSDGETYAQMRIEELQAQHEVLHGQALARGVCNGCTFSLEEHPRDDQNREYLITSTAIHLDAGSFDSAQKGPGELFTCHFTAIDSKVQYRSARLTPKPLVQGPQTAIVAGPDGEEIHTDKYGRVKVQFHWDRYGKGNENASCWVRVSQERAGKKWGSVNIPRVGQEVIVEHLEGDPDRPIITGRVYNGESMPPYDPPKMGTITSFKSNTKGGGGFNELRFEDKKGEEQIFIHAEHNQDIRIKNDCFEWIGNNRHLIVKKDQLEKVENNRHEQVTNDHCEEIGKDRHLLIKGKEAKEVVNTQSFKVGGDVTEEFAKNHSEVVTGNYYLKADNIVIEGLTNVTIKVGNNFIAIEKSGIKIGCDEPSATVETSSMGDTTLKSTMNLKAEAMIEAGLKGNAGAKVETPAMLTLSGSAMVKIN